MPRATTAGDAGADDWTCRWCAAEFPVPSLARAHEERCIARPVREVGAA